MLAAGGSVLVLATALVIPKFDSPNATKQEMCQEVVKSGAVLSREQLSKLLSVPERSSRDAVRQIVAEPYCILPSTRIRQGAEAEREAYPLAFDPQTWFVVLYEDGEYAGYDFSFRRQ